MPPSLEPRKPLNSMNGCSLGFLESLSPPVPKLSYYKSMSRFMPLQAVLLKLVRADGKWPKTFSEPLTLSLTSQKRWLALHPILRARVISLFETALMELRALDASAKEVAPISENLARFFPIECDFSLSWAAPLETEKE